MDFTNGDWRRQVERTQREKGDEMTEGNEQTISVGDKLSIEGLGEYVVREVPPAYNDLRNAMQDAEGIERSSYVGLNTALAGKLNFLILTDNTAYSELPYMVISEAFELSAHLIRNVSLILHEADNLNAGRDKHEISKVIIAQCTEFSREFFAKVYYLLHQLDYHYQVRFRKEDFDPSVPVEINGACEPFTVQRSEERVEYSTMLLEDFAECIYDLMFANGLLQSTSSDNMDTVRNAKRIMGHLASSLHLDLGKEVGLFCDWAIDNRVRAQAEFEALVAEEEKILDDMKANWAEEQDNSHEFPKDGSELDLDLDDIP